MQQEMIGKSEFHGLERQLSESEQNEVDNIASNEAPYL